MLLTLFVCAAAAGAVSLSAAEVGLGGERPGFWRAAGRPCGQGAPADADVTAPGRHREAHRRPARSLTAATDSETAHKPDSVPPVFLEFVASFRPRRSSETPLPTRDKHLSPAHTLALSGVDVETPLGVLQNVPLLSDKEVRLHKATQSSSQPHPEASAWASSGEASSSAASVAAEAAAAEPEAAATTQQPPPPAVGSGPRGRLTTRAAGGDTSNLPDVPKLQRAESEPSAENISLAYNEYQSSGGSGDRLHNTAEQVVFTDTRSASSGNAGATVVEVEISKSEMVVEKETEEMIIKDTTLIIVFSCLAVLVIVVCKILRYIMEYKLGKHEQRVQNRGARPPC